MVRSFGFLDGVSQPIVAGFPGTPLPGQETIKAGIVLIGGDGDTITSRPTWAIDGSFLCFRKLKQLVPEFDCFLKATAPANPDLLGARLVGRWKSGKICSLTNTSSSGIDLTYRSTSRPNTHRRLARPRRRSATQRRLPLRPDDPTAQMPIRSTHAQNQSAR